MECLWEAYSSQCFGALLVNMTVVLATRINWIGYSSHKWMALISMNGNPYIDNNTSDWVPELQMLDFAVIILLHGKTKQNRFIDSWLIGYISAVDLIDILDIKVKVLISKYFNRQTNHSSLVLSMQISLYTWKVVNVYLYISLVDLTNTIKKQ